MPAIMRLSAVAVVAAVAAFTTSGCDWFTTFVIVNRTDVPLFTMAYMEDCSLPLGNRQDYLHEELIQPGEQREYSDTHDGPQPKCVLAVGLDRQLVYAQPYDSGRTYEIAMPVETIGPPIPPAGALPNQTRREQIDDLGQLQVGMIAVGAGIAGLLAIVCVYLTLRLIVRLAWRTVSGRA